MCGCHMEFLYFITISFLHLVHPLLVESTGCCVVNSVCVHWSVSSVRSVTFTSASSTGRLPYCHVRAEHVEETIISGGKLPQPDGCHPVL